MIGLDPAETFRQEAAELLEKLEAALLDLGQRPGDAGLVDEAFRALHTIKGSGAMFGFDRVAAFTHDFETAFDLIRKGKVAAEASIVGLALEAKDHIRELIDDPISTSEETGSRIVGSLQSLLTGGGPDVTAAAAQAPAPMAAAARASGWTIRLSFRKDVLRNGTNPLALLDDLRALGPCDVVADASAVPDIAACDVTECLLTWNVVLRADCPREAIDEVFMFVRDEMELEVEPLADSAVESPASQPEADGAPAQATPEQADKGEPGKRAESRNQTVRVQAERLDELMDRVGELVIAQARLSQLANTGSDPAIKAIAEEVERLASGLRDSTMGVRMVPMGSIFGRFRRLVHDLSRDLGKPVELVTSGEDTELDKTMIERLADPLVHLIRNAIDHGIETPDRRAAAGKSPTGRIELSASYMGAQVLVTVVDDGGGLDTQRIRAKAEEQGLVSPGAQLSDQEIHQFLFHPGFSTAKTVSALSGRGVGMDVVKRTVEAMRGSIDVATTPGRGSSMTLRLPLTLAIIEGLLVRVGDNRYIIPVSAIEECIELTPAIEAQSKGRNFLHVRGDLVPFVHLRQIFSVEGEPGRFRKIIICRQGDQRVGMVVDHIIGSHQTVIKTLTKLHADAPMFSGATIIGDGSVALIVDATQLLAAGQGHRDDQSTAEAA